MIAIISDIHANREALTVVLAEILALNPEKVICLGDIVGYGAEPAWCIDAIRSSCEVVICGNHDSALIYGSENFSDEAAKSVKYHRSILSPAPRTEGGNENNTERQRWDFLKGLSHRYVEEDNLFVHASPRNPVNEYLRERDCRLQLNTKLSENFNRIEKVAFVGHTHKAGIINSNFEFIRPDALSLPYWPAEEKKAIINVGSVGQPRDGDPRACYVTLQAEGIRYHRVEYDVEKASTKIRQNEHLSDHTADRLKDGT
ncbi:MAG: metallophosphoesterase family protein [Candidatus Brocadiia bacterium]